MNEVIEMDSTGHTTKTLPGIQTTQEKTVIFLHLMKTGGRTLVNILKQNYAKNIRFHCGQRSGETLDDLQRLSDEKRRSLRLMYGHMQFGLHDYLSQPCTYITLLRHPIERVISHYYYAVHNPRHYTHKLVTENNMSLSNYVEHGIMDLNNGQTRAIAGDISLQFGFGNQDEALLNAAHTHLETYFSMVGVTERFDESLLLLRHQLGLTNALYTRSNVNHSRPTRKTVSAEDIECIKHYNSLDMQLYADASNRFQNQVAMAGSLFQIELNLLKQFNAQYTEVQADFENAQHKFSRLRKMLKKARHRRNRVNMSLRHHQEEMVALRNSRGGRLWQAWVNLKQKF